MQQQQTRSLRIFAQGLGRSFLQRVLPAAPWYVLLLLLASLALWGSAPWQWLGSTAALLVSAGMVGAVVRRRHRWAAWQVAAALLLLAFSPAWSGLEPSVVARLGMVAVLVAVLQVSWNVLRLLAFSKRLQQVADEMPEARVLELLPPEAVAKVRAWQGGDDACRIELEVVVALAMLYIALREADGSRQFRGWVFASRDLRR